MGTVEIQSASKTNNLIRTFVIYGYNSKVSNDPVSGQCRSRSDCTDGRLVRAVAVPTCSKGFLHDAAHIYLALQALFFL